MIVTIDGPAGAGKSTVARAVARRLKLPSLNSGSIYRAVTVLVLERSKGELPRADATSRAADAAEVFQDRAAILELIRTLEVHLSDEDVEGVDGVPFGRTRVRATTPAHPEGRDLTDRLKLPEVTAEIWRIANDPDCREALLETQRAFARRGGVVAEGRDMGTVVFPEADHKFFLDASPDERARRQHDEALATGRDSDFSKVLASVLERDQRDRNRDHAPLVAADDAMTISTDALSPPQVVEAILGSIEARSGSGTSAGPGSSETGRGRRGTGENGNAAVCRISE